VDFCPRTAASHVDHCLVPKPPKVGQADLGARGHKPALLSLRNPERIRPRNRTKLEVLAGPVGRGAVALDADHPRAPVPVAAELAAADEAREVEVVRNVGSSWRRRYCRIIKITSVNGGMSACSAPITCACTDIAAAPGVGRWRRWRWRRHPHFGSESRRRPQAQRNQRYASEK